METASTYFTAPVKRRVAFCRMRWKSIPGTPFRPISRSWRNDFSIRQTVSRQWLEDLSELESVVQEHVGWLYIRMTCNTQDEALVKAYTFFINEINPHIEPFADRFEQEIAGLSVPEWSGQTIFDSPAVDGE